MKLMLIAMRIPMDVNIRIVSKSVGTGYEKSFLINSYIKMLTTNRDTSEPTSVNLINFSSNL